MSANYFELLKYAATGIASPSMTHFDRMRANALMGGAVQTLTGIPPLTFKADGTPLILWSMKGNTQQAGTPTPDAPITPEFVGVRTANLFPQGSLTGKSTVVRNAFNEIASSIVFNNGQYTISMNITTEMLTGVFKLCFTYMDDSQDKSSWITGTTPTMMLVSNGAKVVKSISITDYNGYTDIVLSNIMLNSGSTALPYEPYGYKIPFTNAGQTTPVYLGQTPTVRRIKKRVFDGSENWTLWVYQTAVMFYTPVADGTELLVVSSHFGTRKTGSMPLTGNIAYNGNSNKNMLFRMIDDTTITTVEGFKAWLAAQYAAGTPVTVWYILAEPTTGIVNEPLAKIGDYADEMHSEDAAVTIPTVKGQNTLTVETDLQPSEMTITYRN